MYEQKTPQNENKTMTERFVRDKKIMMADKFTILKKWDERRAYRDKINSISEYNDFKLNKDFRLEQQKKKNEKKLKFQKDFIFMAVFMAFMAAGISTYTYVKQDAPTAQFAPNTPKTDKTAAIIVISILMGVIVGGILSNVPQKQWSTKNADEFYNRLVVRYFDRIHEQNPNITQNAIETFNPDLGRIVYALLNYNLSKRDMAKLDNLALTIASEFDDGNWIDNFADIDDKMNQAIKIVEHALTKNSELRKTINSVYMGQIPTTLFVAKQNRRGMER